MTSSTAAPPAEFPQEAAELAFAREPRPIVVRAGRLRVVLFGVTGLLGVMSLAVQFSQDVLGHGKLLGAVPLFEMRLEGNVPSWWSTVLLLACAAMFGLTARTRDDGDFRHWAGLGVLFAIASLDEAAEVHERVGLALSGGASLYVYLIPGSLLLIAVALANVGFVRRLPRGTRAALTWGFAIWVFGAVILEMVEPLTGSGQVWDFGQSALQTAQDVAEMTGAILILDALVRRAAADMHRPSVAFSN